MFRAETEGKQATFFDMARAAASVPQDHLLLQMKRAVDWNQIEQALRVYYAEGVGRPSWPPAVLLRVLLLEQYAYLSDREVREQCGYNLLYRAFIGLGVDEAVPDDTTLVRFRARLGEEGVREIFERINHSWEEAGLVDPNRRVLDGSHILSNTALRSWVALMREGRRRVIEAVEAVDSEKAKQLRGSYESEEKGPEPRGEEALRAEQECSRRFVSDVGQVEDLAVKERAALLAKMLQEGDRPVSFVDTEARWGHKREDFSFCGYKTHEAIDPESRIITGVDVLPGNANEAVVTDALLQKQSPAFEEGTVVIGDGLYANSTTESQVKDAHGQPCFAGLKAERVSDAFRYEADADVVVCVEGKRSIGKVRVGNGDLYYFSMKDCASCPRKGECLTKGERQGKAEARRRVFLSDVRKERIVSGEAGRLWREEHLRVRSRIEPKFDEQMNHHGLRRARYWGLAKVTVQVLLNVIVVNMKRGAKLLRAAPRRTATVRVAAATG